MESDQEDHIDRVLEYESAVNDFLKDIPVHEDNGNGRAAEEPQRDEDEEVQVKRKRKPVPKLDEERLLSESGLPRLRKITKSRLKFRGKHHEFSDISRLLNTYQLWLDDLYPRAKFRDGLVMIEKLGHTKRMQVMRKAWVDSTKPNRADSTDLDNQPRLEMSGTEDADHAIHEIAPSNSDGDDRRLSPDTEMHEGGRNQAAQDDIFGEESGLALEPIVGIPRNMSDPDGPDEDELDALLAEQDAGNPVKRAPRRKTMPFAEDDEEDDLDALLAEQSSTQQKDLLSNQQPSRKTAMNHDFADEEEVMAAMGADW